MRSLLPGAVLDPICTHFSTSTHTLAQASVPRPTLSNGSSNASSNCSNGRRKSLGADSPEVVTTGEYRPYFLWPSYLFVFRPSTARLGGKAYHRKGCRHPPRKSENHNASGRRPPDSSRRHKQPNTTSRRYNHSGGEPLVPTLCSCAHPISIPGYRRGEAFAKLKDILLILSWLVNVDGSDASLPTRSATATTTKWKPSHHLKFGPHFSNPCS